MPTLLPRWQELRQEVIDVIDQNEGDIEALTVLSREGIARALFSANWSWVDKNALRQVLMRSLFLPIALPRCTTPLYGWKATHLHTELARWKITQPSTSAFVTHTAGEVLRACYLNKRLELDSAAEFARRAGYQPSMASDLFEFVRHNGHHELTPHILVALGSYGVYTVNGRREEGYLTYDRLGHSMTVLRHFPPKEHGSSVGVLVREVA